MITFPHIFLACIAVFFLAQAVMRFARGGVPYAPIKFLMTFAIWGGVLFFALFPDFARVISQVLHIGENLNTLIFAGFVVVFMFLFRFLRIIEKIESDITNLVRSQAVEQSCDHQKK